MYRLCCDIQFWLANHYGLVTSTSLVWNVVKAIFAAVCVCSTCMAVRIRALKGASVVR